MSFILHLDTYWVDRRDPIGIEPVKSFRARLDRRRRRLHFLRPRLCEGVFPKGIHAYDDVPSLETFKLIKAQGES